MLGGGEVSGGCEVREVNKVMDGLVEGWGCSGFVEGLKVGMDSGGEVKKGGYVKKVGLMRDGYEKWWG